MTGYPFAVINMIWLLWEVDMENVVVLKPLELAPVAIIVPTTDVPETVPEETADSVPSEVCILYPMLTDALYLLPTPEHVSPLIVRTAFPPLTTVIGVDKLTKFEKTLAPVDVVTVTL